MLKLIVIAGIWINPVQIVTMDSHNKGCHIHMRYSSTYQSGKRTIKAPLPCNEVAAIINKEIE